MAVQPQTIASRDLRAVRVECEDGDISRAGGVESAIGPNTFCNCCGLVLLIKNHALHIGPASKSDFQRIDWNLCPTCKT